MKNEKQGPTMVRCRVLPGNKYGKDGAGSIVEVDSSEYARVRHCLISLEDEKRREQEAAAFVSDKTEKARAELEGYREAYRKQHEEMKRRQAEISARQARAAEEAARKLFAGKE